MPDDIKYTDFFAEDAAADKFWRRLTIISWTVIIGAVLLFVRC